MNDIYTPPEAALEILEERRLDNDLMARVLQYLGETLPSDCLELDQPVAVLARYVARGTTEELSFIESAQINGFRPFLASYKSDRFTVRNPEKVDTARPPILWKKGQRTRGWVVEPPMRNGSIGELATMYGCTLSEYQANLREIVFEKEGLSELAANVFDMGGWYRLQAVRFGYEEGASLASYYYTAMLALFTVYGALYEDFDGGPNAKNGDLTAFMGKVVRPAITTLEQELGVRPIIIRLPFRVGMNETNLSFLNQDEAEQVKRLGRLPLASARVGSGNE